MMNSPGLRSRVRSELRAAFENCARAGERFRAFVDDAAVPDDFRDTFRENQPPENPPENPRRKTNDTRKTARGPLSMDIHILLFR